MALRWPSLRREMISRTRDGRVISRVVKTDERWAASEEVQSTKLNYKLGRRIPDEGPVNLRNMRSTVGKEPEIGKISYKFLLFNEKCEYEST